MKIDWKSLKNFLDTTGLYKFLNYIELDVNYYVWLFYEGETFSTILDKGTIDCEVFISEYKNKSIIKNDITEDGMKFSRTVFVGKSRMMHCLFTSFTTSILQNNDSSGFITMRIRDLQKNIIQDSNEAVYTELDFCPHLTNGYGLHGGSIESMEDIDTEFVVNAILAPDIPSSYGGSLYFISNRVLKTPYENLQRSAINVGEIPGGIVGLNVVRVQIKHDKGIQKKFQVEIKYYI
jgi:hypothetical protein